MRYLTLLRSRFLILALLTGQAYACPSLWVLPDGQQWVQIDPCPVAVPKGGVPCTRKDPPNLFPILNSKSFRCACSEKGYILPGAGRAAPKASSGWVADYGRANLFAPVRSSGNRFVGKRRLQVGERSCSAGSQAGMPDASHLGFTNLLTVLHAYAQEALAPTGCRLVTVHCAFA